MSTDRTIPISENAEPVTAETTYGTVPATYDQIMLWVREFQQRCVEDHHTDTGAAHELLQAIVQVCEANGSQPLVDEEPTLATIWKFGLDMGLTELDLPAGAQVIHAGNQDSVPTISALVNPDQKVFRTRRFQIFGTGHLIADADNLQYIGTYISGRFVWHVFELI